MLVGEFLLMMAISSACAEICERCAPSCCLTQDMKGHKGEENKSVTRYVKFQLHVNRFKVRHSRRLSHYTITLPLEMC